MKNFCKKGTKVSQSVGGKCGENCFTNHPMTALAGCTWSSSALKFFELIGMNDCGVTGSDNFLSFFFQLNFAIAPVFTEL